MVIVLESKLKLFGYKSCRLARLWFAPRLARRPDIAKYNGADFDPERSELSLFAFHRKFLDIYNPALWLHRPPSHAMPPPVCTPRFA